MAALVYDGRVIHFDDRTLTHLQIVIVQKLNRNERLLLSWRDSPGTGDGRTAVWISPDIPLLFKFDGPRIPEIDRSWLEKLAETANSSTGLIVTDSDGKPIYAEALDGDYPGRIP